MPHPCFELLRQLACTGLHAASAAQRQAVRHGLLEMRVWTRRQPLRQRAPLTPDAPDCPQLLELYTSRRDAQAANRRAALLCAPLRTVIALAEAEWIDATLSEDACSQYLPHDMLLALRDLDQLGNPGIPMSAGEILLQRETIMTFVACARRYCACHSDVRALQLATLSEPGIKSLLVGRLDARSYPRHAAALAALARRLFLPAWRFVLLQEGNTPAALAHELQGGHLCYERHPAGNRWRRLRRMLARGVAAV